MDLVVRISSKSIETKLCIRNVDDDIYIYIYIMVVLYNLIYGPEEMATLSAGITDCEQYTVLPWHIDTCNLNLNCM